MEYRRLGRSGLRVSKLVLGTMNFGDRTGKMDSIQIIYRALDEGINLFDCADIYAGGNSERIVGQALSDSSIRCNTLLITKCFMPTGEGPNSRGNSRHHIMEACEASLKRLKTDYIDIYILHRTDFDVPQEETLSALDMLMRQGKIRQIGCSTHPAWRTVEGFWISDKLGLPKFVCEQPPYNILDRRIENEIVPMCRDYDLGIVSWSPLAQGVLAGRYQDAASLPAGSRGTVKRIYGERITDEGIRVAEKLGEKAVEKDCTTAQLALSWVMAQDGITGAIVGPRTMAQFEDLLGSVDIELTRDDLKFFDRLVSPGGHLSNHFNTSGWMK